MTPSPWSWSAQQQLDKNENLKLSDLQELKTWMNGEQHLPTVTDEHLVLFLHACEYDKVKTKETIEKCYSMRTNYKELFTNRDPHHQYIQEITKVVLCSPLEGFDKDGNIVIWIKLLDKNPEKYYYGASLKQVLMVMDAIQLEYGPVNGYVYIIDGKGYSLGHILRTSLSLCKKFITYSQEGSTFFPKSIYMVNVSSVLDKAVTLVKPFMKSDLFKVISFYKPGKYEILQSQIPEDILPEEYGGKGRPLENIHDDYLQKMSNYREWFTEEETLRIDENKRKGGKKNGTSRSTTSSETENLSLRTLELD